MSIQNGAELLRRTITDRTKETVGERVGKQMSFLFHTNTVFLRHRFPSSHTESEQRRRQQCLQLQLQSGQPTAAAAAASASAEPA